MSRPSLRYLPLLSLCVAIGAGTAQAVDLDLYDQLLTKHTRSVDDLARTRVDYAAIAKDPDWKTLVASLERSDPKALKTKEQKLAFWINAYNILAIDLVQKNYPLKSIKDIGSVFSPVWKQPAGTIAGKSYSLDEIEHGIVRPLGDARAHAGVICASTSCPELRREAWRSETVDAQLDESVRIWVADRGKGMQIDRSRKTVTLSKIFDWFEEDFESAGGAVAFVARYASEADRQWLLGDGRNARVEYFDYDWGVNAVQ